MPNLEVRGLDTRTRRGAFMGRWGDVLRAILDRGTYLDDADIGPLVDTALPGGDEIFAALELADLFDARLREPEPRRRIVVDTAPTGHTLRLLDLPRTFAALLHLLDAMQNKHRFMVRTLMRTYKADDADAFLARMGDLVGVLLSTLGDRDRCAAVMVTNDQPIVQAETERYLDALAERQMRVAAIVWNNSVTMPRRGDRIPRYLVPKLAEWPVGVAGLDHWLARLGSTSRDRATRPPRTLARPHRRAAGASPSTEGLLRPLTIVAGKGGVGKTTVAAALALESAGRHRTLVVSTDPAPSLADALAQEIPDADTPVRGVASLVARQMDASAAFARLRETYQTRVDAIFEGLVAKGVDLTHDRAIARDLLALAPPGVDEIYALTLLTDALFKDAYERVIVDPAPTGHLLRLLEMPQLALSWSHQLMRLLLKYKDVVGLGDTARELLDLSRDLRALDTLLHDATRSGVVIVALDEPVVRSESRRLATEIGRLGIAVAGVVWNRADLDADAPPAGLPVPEAAVQVVAPAADPPPVGVEALRRWRDSWIAQ